MNPNSTGIRPRGIEWEFSPGVPEIVALLPGGSGDGDWECWDLLADDLGALTLLQRETLRAWIKVTGRRLDASEPTQFSAVSA